MTKELTHQEIVQLGIATGLLVENVDFPFSSVPHQKLIAKLKKFAIAVQTRQQSDAKATDQVQH